MKDDFDGISIAAFIDELFFTKKLKYNLNAFEDLFAVVQALSKIEIPDNLDDHPEVIYDLLTLIDMAKKAILKAKGD